MSEPGGGSTGVSEASEASPGDPWTVLRMIRWSGEYLRGKGIEQGRLDGEHLLAHALGLGRLQLYLQYERPLTPEELATYKPLLRRRARREPLQYILGRASFRELELRTDPRALVPRPETERLVHEVLEWVAARSPGSTSARGLTALDVGTGTGCIALSLAREGPFDRVLATDTSEDALALARANAGDAGVEDRVELVAGPVYEPVGGRRFDVVVANPPYVAESEREELQPEVRDWEPGVALFAGPDGLDVLRALVAGAPRHVLPGGLLALEVGLGQAESVASLVEATGAFRTPSVRRDLTGRPRMVLAEARDGAGARGRTGAREPEDAAPGTGRNATPHEADAAENSDTERE